MEDKLPPVQPWDDLFFQIEDATQYSSEIAQQTISRYTKGSKAIIDSLEIPVGQTPKNAIWTLNKSTLYHYEPVKPEEKRYPVPLLLVYALINKPFIFDLTPGRSFVEFLLDAGFDVYLLDWGIPGPEDCNTTFDDYVAEYLHRAVRKTQKHSGSREISLLGYCIGATIAAVYAAMHPEVSIKNMILLTAPIDFSDQPKGSMAVWLDTGSLDIDKLVDTMGNVPGELIALWAKLLKPVENFMGAYVNLLKMIDDENAVRGWQAINRWVEDVVPFAGEAFRQFVKVYLRGNALVKGEHKINGQAVNLENIDASLLNIVAEYDHLVSKSQSESIMSLVSSRDTELIVIPSTHVGIMVSSRAKFKLWPEIVEWLGTRSGEKALASQEKGH